MDQNSNHPKSQGTDSTSSAIAELKEQGWSPAHLNILSKSLKSGDMTAGSRIFSAPKEMVVNWIRANLANLAINSESAKVQAECWKTLLNDLNGTSDKAPVKIEVVVQDNGMGVRVESPNS